MKDIEKIKSEDLACQVADANPANFAIEQEVAQLVGATVPAPTQPSADDARELPAQLLVFLRRALTPIQTALRTALTAIYAHLDSRCTDYTPAAYASFTPTHHAYDPMGSTPRTLPNLLTAITAFDSRKISNGSATADGIPDGTSLVKLVCEQATANEVLKIADEHRGWTMNRALPTFPNATDVQLGCQHIVIPSSQFFINGFTNLDELNIDYAEDLRFMPGTYSYNIGLIKNSGAKKITIRSIKEIHPTQSASYNYKQVALLQDCTSAEELIMDNMSVFDCDFHLNNCPALKRIVFGKITYHWENWGDPFDDKANLIDVEIGAGTAINLRFSAWNPTNVLADADKTATFLQNFKEHIALRLTSNGSGKTLTLSQAVRDAIHAAEATYGIEAIIVTQKGWTLSPAPGASSQ